MLGGAGMVEFGPVSPADSDMPASPGAGLDAVFGDVFARAAE
jgi:hypothetical protein